MSGRAYPIVEELTLAPPRRTIFGSRRDVAELPQQRPGTVLVFATPGGHEVLSGARHFNGREDVIIDAVAVSVIDTRERIVTIPVELPSGTVADSFHVEIG